MKRRRRAASRRTILTMARIAEEMRAARGSLGLSKSGVAATAGVARSTVDRVESGTASIEVSLLAAVLAAVGLDLSLRTYLSEAFRVRDHAHAALVGRMRGEARHWRARIEVPAGEHGRAADLVLYGADEVLHIEVERRLVDFQAQLRSAHLKRDALALTTDRPVRLVLAIADTRANRMTAAPLHDLIRSQLPAVPRAVFQAIRSGTSLGRDGFVWLRTSRMSPSGPAVPSGKTSHEGGSGRGLAG